MWQPEHCFDLSHLHTHTHTHTERETQREREREREIYISRFFRKIAKLNTQAIETGGPRHLNKQKFMFFNESIRSKKTSG